eukprot:gene8179-9056_t
MDDYVSCTKISKKKTKKKSKFFSKLIPKRSKKNRSKDENNSSDIVDSPVVNGEAEEECRSRLQQMEQTREISALKNHIEKLEGQLNNPKHEEHIEIEDGIVGEAQWDEREAVKSSDQLGVKQSLRTDSVDMDFNSNTTDEGNKDTDGIMWRNIIGSFGKKPVNSQSDSDTEEFVYLGLETENDRDASLGAGHQTGGDKSGGDEICGDEIGGSDSSREEKVEMSRRYFKRRSGEVSDFEDEKSLVQKGEDENGGNKEHVIDGVDCSEMNCEKIDFAVDSCEELIPSRDGNEVNINKEDCGEDLHHGRSKNIEEQWCLLKEHSEFENVECFEVNEENVRKLETVNEELKKRINELEDEIWLAKEDKANTQAMLEMQKDKAIRNLAFRFEEINKKTLCEFKTVFERKLKELNDEKLDLQNKLKKADAEKQTSFFDESDLKEKLLISDKRVSELEKENILLKQHCHKMSASFGQLKKQQSLGHMEVKTEGSDAETQTDDVICENTSILVKCENSLLQNIHNDIKNIAKSVSTLDENIPSGIGTSSCHSNSGSPCESLDLTCSKTEEYSESNDTQDSGIFGNEFSSNVFDNDEIEAKLHRIEDKYQKISEQLEGFENSKLTDTNSNESSPKTTETKQNREGSKTMELDPEIQKLVDEVNLKYNAYFYSKLA